MKVMPQIGTVCWISRRPVKRDSLVVVDEVDLNENEGLVGDHYSGMSKKRQVTLIQQEHLDTISSIMGRTIGPEMTRRNIVVSGINLIACKDEEIAIGNDVRLKITGPCVPCSNMEKSLGPGGYNAMRGHGGVTATVLRGGKVSMNDEVRFLSDS